MEKSRWKLLFSFLAIVALFALVAAACGDDDDDDSGDDAADPTATTAPVEDKMGGEITVQNLEFSSFDPHYSSFSQDLSHHSLVFRGMYKISADGSPVPEMAAALPEISADGLTYTIKIREGLLWSDDDPLDANDFVAGLQRTCNWENAGEYQYIAANIVGCNEYYDAEANDGIDAAAAQTLLDSVGVALVDDHTLTVTIIEPQPTFTIILAMWVAWPVPTHIVTTPNQEWPGPEALAFNGPFKVDSYTPGDNMVFSRNDNYAGDHLAYLDKVTYKYIEDTETANNAYRSGELDMARANTATFAALQAEFPNELVSTPGTVTIGLQMNLEREPLDNYKVRLAISQAIDRETLNTVILQNANIPTTTWTPPSVAGIDCVAIDCFPLIGFDEEAAKANLAEAGYPDGEGLPTFEYVISDTPSNQAIAEFLQGEWDRILGLKFDIVIVDSPTRSARFRDEDFDFFPGGWGQDYPDPENWIIGLYNTDGGLNHYNCSDPEIDRLIGLAQFNTNDTERRQQYVEINRLISEGLCGIAPGYHRANHYLVSESLGGAREFTQSNDFVLAGDWAAEEWYLIK